MSKFVLQNIQTNTSKTEKYLFLFFKKKLKQMTH